MTPVRIELRVILDSLRDAAIAAGVAALLALPLLGIRLSDSAQGGPPEYRLLWVLYAAAAVFVGRLAITCGRLFLGQVSFLPRAKIDRVLTHTLFEPLMIAAMIYVNAESFIGHTMSREAAEIVKAQFIQNILSARKHFKEHHQKAMVKN